MVRGFGGWLHEQPVIAAPSVEEEIQVFEALLALAGRTGLDTSDAVEQVVDALDVSDDPESLGPALMTLLDYVHFRMEVTDDPVQWATAHEAVESAIGALELFRGPLGQALAQAEAIEPELRRSALIASPAVAQVGPLLEWIGTSRKVAPSGGLRRTDIGEVAAMLDIRAVGVNKRPPFEPGQGGLFPPSAGTTIDHPVQAMSMFDVPLLAAWWEALHSTGILERGSTVVRPGPAASTWLAEDGPPLDLAETVAGMTAVQVLVQGDGPLEGRVVELAIVRLVDALAPEPTAVEVGDSAWTRILDLRVQTKFEQLAHAGLVTIDGSGKIVTSPMLRGMLATVVMTTTVLISAVDDDEV